MGWRDFMTLSRELPDNEKSDPHMPVSELSSHHMTNILRPGTDTRMVCGTISQGRATAGEDTTTGHPTATVTTETENLD